MEELDRFERLLDKYQDAMEECAKEPQFSRRVLLRSEAHDYRNQLIDMFKGALDDIESLENTPFSYLP